MRSLGELMDAAALPRYPGVGAHARDYSHPGMAPPRNAAGNLQRYRPRFSTDKDGNHGGGAFRPLPPRDQRYQRDARPNPAAVAARAELGNPGVSGRGGDLRS
jgi:hypothetical protein